MTEDLPVRMKDDREKSSGPFVVDPSIPKWLCQNCRHPLSVVGAESYAQKFGAGPSKSGVQALSVHGGKAMDQSFVVLPATANSVYRNRNSPEGGSLPFPNVGDSSSALQTNSAINNSSRTVHGGKVMDQSFLVLPATATSVYRNRNSPEGDSLPFPNVVGDSSSALQTNSAINNSSRTVLKRAFDIVSSQTQVEKPLCLECMRVLSENIARELEDINRDTKAYEACLKQLEEESPSGLSGANFLQEKEKVEEEEKKLKAAIVEIEKQCMDFRHQLQELELKSKRFEEREERFWHEFNDYSLQLTTHQEERDAILAKIEVTQTQLEQLKHTNVLNDAFRISYDGDFGTINNFRLGRLPKIPVEWDEINAAWGQACLLLHTMAMHSGANFSYRIIPMGSYPTILDSQNNKYELFGPVNQFWSTHYDKAMTLFLICLKEFGDYASEKDRAANVPPEKCFKFPKKIEDDKVGDLTIHQSFNTTENWAKALKYMLCDLKWALHWFVAHSDFKCPGTVAMASGSSSLYSTDDSLT